MVSLGLRERSRFWLDALGEESNHLRIERVGLGQAAHGSSVITNLTRVDDAERQPNTGQHRRDRRLEAAGRLQDDKDDGQSLEAAD